jgi:hypothetical protein
VIDEHRALGRDLRQADFQHGLDDHLRAGARSIQYVRPFIAYRTNFAEREDFLPSRDITLGEVTVSSDEALMLEIRRGSRPAFEELFARYRDALYGFFRRRLPSAARAEELTQDTFLAVLRATVRYEPRAAVRSYLFGIAWNLVCAERRKSGRDETVEIEPSTAASPETSLWVREALAKLEPNERRF